MPETICSSQVQLDILNQADCLWICRCVGTNIHYRMTPPEFEMDGNIITGLFESLCIVAPGAPLFGDVSEYRITGLLQPWPDIRFTILLRISESNPIIRFQYRLHTDADHRLTKSTGRDRFDYFSIRLPEKDRVTEIRLTEYDEFHHCYLPAERPVAGRLFKNSMTVDGPILTATNKASSLLLAYEHGSQLPDRYLGFALSPDRTVTLQAVKGNYWHGQPVDGFETGWMQIGALGGAVADPAKTYRSFILNHMSPNAESRKPYIFYNTWNFQERNKNWYEHQYLDSMNPDRLLQEIDIAHEMGIEVFVIDTGWYQKTGDWEVSAIRFPDEMKTVKARLDGYGMKLGLWFNAMAARSSEILKRNADCKISWNGRHPEALSVWETEESHPMCLVSRFHEDYADELIRLVKDVGVTYFKWDAIDQYGCNDPGHFHGTAENSQQERADCYAYLLPRYMGKVIDKLCAACPEAIVDFDITEGERAAGLQFLASGKYFIINNGPYFRSFDDPQYTPGCGMGMNALAFPGPARARLCRSPLLFDKWIPSVLFLAHYLPDDPATSQYINIASLILGQNGIWGDLPALSRQGVERFGKTLARYKQVREDITKADPVRQGNIGGVPEIHEKINPETGRGVVVIFFNYKSAWKDPDDTHFGGSVDYVTQNSVDQKTWTHAGVKIKFDNKSRAVIHADFNGPGAKILFFGVE